MMKFTGLHGTRVSANTAAHWYTNPAILIPGGLLLVYLLIYLVCAVDRTV